MDQSSRVRTYTGGSEQAAWDAFQRDAAEAARYGWAPFAHQWGQGFLEVTYRPRWPTVGTAMGEWRLPPDAGKGKRSGSVERATIVAAVIGAVGGLASLVLVTRNVPDWDLVSGLNDFAQAWFWASFVCWVIGVVVGIRWQRLDGCGAWLVVGVLGPSSALVIMLMMSLVLLSWCPGCSPSRSEGTVAPGPPYPDPVDGVYVYDQAGVLREDTITAAEAAATRFQERTGTPLILYTQVKPASDTYEDAVSDAAALLEQWDMGPSSSSAEGLVVLFDLDTSSTSLCNWQVQLYAGAGV